MLRSVAFTAVFSLASTMFADAIPTNFFPQQNFSGTPVHAAVPSCPDVAAQRCFQPAMPFSILSVKPGGATQRRNGSLERSWVPVALFELPNYRGICVAFKRDAPSFADTILGSRPVGSFLVGQECPPQVVLYSDAHYAGAALGLTGSVPALATVNFNDIASSARMNGAASVALFQDNNYQGRCVTLRADTPAIPSGTSIEEKVSSAIVNGRCPTSFRVTIVNAAKYTLSYRLARSQNGTLAPSAAKEFEFVHNESGREQTVPISLTALDAAGKTVSTFFNMRVADEVKITATGTLPDGTVAGATCEPASACR